MKLLLPEYNYVCKDSVAEVKDGILYIYRAGSFRDIMYELTYLIFGQCQCYYCHRKLRQDMQEQDNQKYFSQITLDHLIPQDFGGPTITNNLRPCCSDCNSTKGNMFPNEFEDLRKFEGKKDKQSKVEKRKFKEQILLTQEKRRYGEIKSIPDEWYTNELIRNIYVNFWIAQPLGVVYEKQEKLFKKYRRLQKDIVISANKFLLDGFNTILLAKNVGKENLGVIVLENVIFKGFPV